MAVPTTYLTSNKNVGAILQAIQRAGVPQRFTYDFLKALGFSSSSDRPIVPLLKALGFLDASGIPTERYLQYRDPRVGPGVLAEAVREAYDEVFTIDQDAPRLSTGELRGIFLRLTGKQDRVAEQMATTFRTLASHADFSALRSGAPQAASSGSADSVDEFPVQAGGLHPLLIGLMRELPPAGDPFPAHKQKDWLEIAQATFRLIYGEAPEPAAPTEGPREDGESAAA